MFRFYYVVANVQKRNIIKYIFSVSITSKVCFLFILIKQKHSAVSKKQLSVCCSYLGYQITKIQKETQIYILMFNAHLFVNLGNSRYICSAMHMDIGNIIIKGELT